MEQFPTEFEEMVDIDWILSRDPLLAQTNHFVNNGSIGDNQINIWPHQYNSQQVQPQNIAARDQEKVSKRHRTQYTSKQLTILERQLAESPYPNEKQLLQLAQILNLTEKNIKVWFQNRRMKVKKNGKKNNKENICPTPIQHSEVSSMQPVPTAPPSSYPTLYSSRDNERILQPQVYNGNYYNQYGITIHVDNNGLCHNGGQVEDTNKNSTYHSHNQPPTTEAKYPELQSEASCPDYIPDMDRSVEDFIPPL